ncbi:DUF4232 domain-containing protein [Streptomyces sp. NPDC058067]|uniref:DUF4232 domain-containing protein n=1 Tax=Streptomyces sp. NPDC058067 TaxID=3346324 RepID=UPI0036E01EFA
MRATKQKLALALAAGLSLTACQSGGGGNDASAGSSDSGSPAASAAPSSSSDATTGGGSSSSGGSNGGSSGGNSGGSSGGSAGGNTDGTGHGQINTGPCRTANLTITATHGMGEGDVLVSLKNTSDACSLKGFPGVDLKADSGQGGISAARSNLAAPEVVLQNGATTRFTLHTPRNDSGGSGVRITQMVVTPPNETHSKTVPISLNLPVTDGSQSGQGVTVDPVGTGKQ